MDIETAKKIIIKSAKKRILELEDEFFSEDATKQMRKLIDILEYYDM